MIRGPVSKSYKQVLLDDGHWEKSELKDISLKDVKPHIKVRHLINPESRRLSAAPMRRHQPSPTSHCHSG